MAYQGPAIAPARPVPTFETGFATGSGTEAGENLWTALSVAFAPFLGPTTNPTKVLFGKGVRPGKTSFSGGRAAAGKLGWAWEFTSTNDQIIIGKDSDVLPTGTVAQTIIVGYHKTDGTARDGFLVGADIQLFGGWSAWARALGASASGNMQGCWNGSLYSFTPAAGHTARADHVWAFTNGAVPGGTSGAVLVDGEQVAVGGGGPVSRTASGANMIIGNAPTVPMSADLIIIDFCYVFSRGIPLSAVRQLMADPGMLFRPKIHFALLSPSSMGGAVAGTSSLTGTINGLGDLAGAATAAASPSGTLDAISDIAGAAAGSAAASGSVNGLGNVAGSASGIAVTFGTLASSGGIDVEGGAGIPKMLYLRSFRSKVATSTTAEHVPGDLGGYRSEWIIDRELLPRAVSVSIVLAYGASGPCTVRLRQSTDYTTAGAASGAVLSSTALPGATYPEDVVIEVGEVDVPEEGLWKLTFEGPAASTLLSPALIIVPIPTIATIGFEEDNVPDVTGIDFDIVDDLRASFVLTSGLDNLGKALARRFQTPEGALAEIGDDPDYGFDLRALLNADMTLEEIGAQAPRIEQEARKDERVLDATMTSTYTFGAYELVVDLEVQTAQGPFRLVLGVGTASVEVLDANLAQPG